MITLTGGNIQDGKGNPLNGFITLQLTADSSVIATPGLVVRAIPLTLQFANGNLVGSCKCYSNAELTPGTQYQVSFTDGNRSRLGDPMLWQFTQAAGATVDIGTMVTTQGGITFPAPVLQTPNVNQSVVQPAGTNFSISGAGNITPDANATEQLGGQSLGWKDIIAAGTPWFDIRAFGGVGDGATDNTAAFNSAVAAAKVVGGVIFFPPGQFFFNSKPAAIGAGVSIFGCGNGSNQGFGTALIANYNEATPANGFLTWDGSFSVAAGTGARVQNLLIAKNNGFTGGVGIKLTGSDDNHRAGFFRLDHVEISIIGTGTWNYNFYVDGSNNFTVNSQGIRDIWFTDFRCATATTKSIFLNNAAHLFWDGGLVDGNGGGEGITVTGTGGGGVSTLNSDDINLTDVSVFGSVTFDECSNVMMRGQIRGTGTLSITGNAANCSFDGLVASGTITNSSATSAVLLRGSGANSIVAVNTRIAATATGLSTGQAGDLNAVRSLTTGFIFLGSDANIAIGRDTATTVEIFANAAGNGNLKLPFGSIVNYNGVATVSNGVPSIYAKADLTGQTADVGSTLLYAVPAGAAGSYRITGYCVVTSPGTTSTLPAIQIAFTDSDTSVAASTQVGLTATTNTVGATNTAHVSPSNSVVINAKAGVNINFSTAGYASTGTPMQFALHVKLEYLGS